MGGLAVAGLVGTSIALYPTLTKETPKPKETVLEFEKPRPAPASAEDGRDQLSGQHRQVRQSWENPGVYVCGSNSGGVAAPGSREAVVKTPRRLSYFDGQLLRDLRLDRESGAAITENGDLVQWGVGFSRSNPTPRATLRGKDLVKIGLSQDRVIGLSRDGSVYSIPVSESDQASGAKPAPSSSWLPFWTASPSPVSFRRLKPEGLSWGETVTDIATGLEHTLMLTSRGRLFSAAASTTNYPDKGQLGVPGLTWDTRPPGSFDQPHEVTMLRDVKVRGVAAGDRHSLALDDRGRVFVFGDNSSGQLGFEPEPEIPYVDGPVPLPVSRIYSGSGLQPSVTSIAAGGANSFFTVDATRRTDHPPGAAAAQRGRQKPAANVTADTWACGAGILGSLGTGKWTHVSLGPTRIRALSGLSEWSEKAGAVVPIRLARLSVGSTHAAAVMGNATRVVAPSSSGKASGSDSNTSFGADVLLWGGNEHYQLGTGRRNNLPVPTYIAPLDGEGAGKAAREGGQAQSQDNRLQITPRSTARLGKDGKGRKVSMEQRIECGRYVTAVYSAA